MYFTLDAACLCKTGKIRKRNEDNFYFNGRSLPFGNTGLKHPVTMTKELSRETLLEHVCDYGYEGASNMIDVYIRHLRKKVDEGFAEKLIHTVRGRGYVMRRETAVHGRDGAQSGQNG